MIKFYEFSLENSATKNYKKKYYEFLKNSNSITSSEAEKMIDIININSANIINNFDTNQKFLLYGDIQSGKTNNLIALFIDLFNKKKLDVVIYFIGMQTDLLKQNQKRFFQTFKEIDEDNFFIIENINLNYEEIERKVNEGKQIIINSLKIGLRRDQISFFLESMPKKIKFLIIDDEGDEASLTEDNIKKTNEILKLENRKILCITASPFSNLYYNHKNYDYYVYLQPSENYLGIEDFKKMITKFDDELDWEICVRHTIVRWILKSYDLKDSQLLINIFNKKEKHSHIEKFIQNFLTELKNPVIAKIWGKSDYPKIIDFIENRFHFRNIIVSNSNEEASKKIDSGLEIIVGGLKLSRGITYKNLNVEIMLNMGKVIKAGTLIQRARWLGYRKNIEKMEILMNSKIYESYREIEDLMKLTRNYDIKNNNYKEIVDEQKYKFIKP